MSDRRRPHIARPAPAASAPPEAFARNRGKQDSGKNRASPRELGAAVIGRVLILDEDSAAASEIADALTLDGHAVELRPNLEDGIASLAKVAPDVVVVDPFGGESGGGEIIDKLKRMRDPTGASPEVVIVTALHDVDSAVDALHRGASDYLVKPTAPGRLRLAIARALERLRLLNENGRLRHDLALFASAQRILETLDPAQLAAYGLDALCSFTRAEAGAVFAFDDILAERGLSEAEARALGRLPRPVNFTDRIPLADQGVVLQRFREAMVLDLDEDRAAVLVTTVGFDAAKEESGLFLARQLQTAFRNVLRFADAEREARRDSLTGLWNARAFQEATNHLVARAQLERLPFSLLFLDVDHFKGVNDRHGHVTGSRLLVEIATVLERCLREGDVLARYGGDEFTVLLPEVDTEAALIVAERIRSTIAAHRFLGSTGAALPITVCVGVSSFPRHARDAQAILDLADRAMYVGKGSIRNSVHVAEPKPAAVPGAGGPSGLA
jgi:two-component system, cell cycle response regulator